MKKTAEIKIQIETREDLLVSVDNTEVVSAPLNKITKGNYIAFELDCDGKIIVPKDLRDKVVFD